MAKTRAALPPRAGGSDSKALNESQVRTETLREPTKPVHQVRLGHIRAAVWVNHGPNGAWYNVTFSRLYKDEGGEWRNSDSYGRDDLLLLGKVADRVHSWIYQQQQQD